MTIRPGVHETHCCPKHGCKYGADDCPVTLGLHTGNPGCELCSDFLESFFEDPPSHAGDPVDSPAKTEAHVDWVRDGDEVLKEAHRGFGSKT